MLNIGWAPHVLLSSRLPRFFILKTIAKNVREYRYASFFFNEESSCQNYNTPVFQDVRWYTDSCHQYIVRLLRAGNWI
ncbi:hypothetical protein BX666DRAFT_1987196 [Dichotomocladium elegans]|nr:hypothetical protein BX666DRAFT_1987196 [Dichotomocladium elegans]